MSLAVVVPSFWSLFLDLTGARNSWFVQLLDIGLGRQGWEEQLGDGAMHETTEEARKG